MKPSQPAVVDSTSFKVQEVDYRVGASVAVLAKGTAVLLTAQRPSYINFTSVKEKLDHDLISKYLSN